MINAHTLPKSKSGVFSHNWRRHYLSATLERMALRFCIEIWSQAMYFLTRMALSNLETSAYRGWWETSQFSLIPMWERPTTCLPSVSQRADTTKVLMSGQQAVSSTKWQLLKLPLKQPTQSSCLRKLQQANLQGFLLITLTSYKRFWFACWTQTKTSVLLSNRWWCTLAFATTLKL